VAGVAGEADTAGGLRTGVAVDHLDDADGGPQVVGDAGVPTVGASPVPVPRVEHGGHGSVQLYARVLGKVLPGILDEKSTELAGKTPQGGGVQLSLVPCPGLAARLTETVLEHGLVQTEDGVPVHVDESAVAVPGEPFAASPDEPWHDVIDKSDVEDRVHHPGHRPSSAGAHGNEQGSSDVAEPASRALLELGDRGRDLTAEAHRRMTVREVLAARCGADDEALGNRKTQRGHLAEVGALPPSRSAIPASPSWSEYTNGGS